MSDAQGPNDANDKNDINADEDVHPGMLPSDPEYRTGRGRPIQMAKRATAREVWLAGGSVEDVAKAARATVRTVLRWRIEEGWPDREAVKPPLAPNAAAPTVVAEQALVERGAEVTTAAVAAEVAQGWPPHRAAMAMRAGSSAELVRRKMVNLLDRVGEVEWKEGANGRAVAALPVRAHDIMAMALAFKAMVKTADELADIQPQTTRLDITGQVNLSALPQEEVLARARATRDGISDRLAIASESVPANRHSNGHVIDVDSN